MKNWLTVIGYTVGIIAFIVLMSWYTMHIWTDCLEENSVLTCIRMLSK